MVDPADVEEVVLVIVHQVPLHLGGVHATVGLGDINYGRAEVRKDIRFHPRQCQRGC